MEVLDEYFKRYRYFLEFGQKRSANSIRSINSDLRQFKEFIEEVEPIKIITEIDSYKIKRFLSWGSRKNISKRSLNRKLSTLRGFFKFLQKEQIILKNPGQFVDFAIFEKETPSFIKKENIERLREVIKLESANGVRDRLIIEILYSSGITSQELLLLGENTFNLDERELLVIQGKSDRKVFFSERVIKYFKEYIDLKKKKYKEKYNKDILFVNGSGTRLSDRSLRRIIERYCKIANIEEEVTPYSFRHTFALHLVVKGMPLEYIQTLLGHSTLELVKEYKELSKKKHIKQYIESKFGLD